MDIDDLTGALEATLEDGCLSRAERKAIDALLRDEDPSPRRLDVIRHAAFELVRARLRSRDDQRLVEWLEDVVRIISAARTAERPETLSEVWFSPDGGCGKRVAGLVDGARSTLDVCVFTITHDLISRSLLAAHRRGVEVRVISDDAKALDLGSDLPALAEAGIPVAVDDSPAHMHHKFAIVDRRVVLTGSFNWTRSAVEQNQENLVVTDQPALIRRFGAEFDRLWKRFSR